MLVAGLLGAAEARAASLTLNPNTSLVGTPGSTIGWGYSITSDPGRGIVDYFGVGATIDASKGSVSLIFDYPEVGPGATVALAYDGSSPIPANRKGLFELTFASGLAPGQAVVGTIYGTFFFDNETTQEFELPFTARVGSAPIPEPTTLLLLLGGAAGLLRRRGRLLS